MKIIQNIRNLMRIYSKKLKYKIYELAATLSSLILKRYLHFSYLILLHWSSSEFVDEF